MNELTQCYKVILSEDHYSLCKPAQFVHPDSINNIISGFVSSVEGREAIFCTFEPIELPENAINVKNILTEEELYILLSNALEQNPEMVNEWIGALND